MYIIGKTDDGPFNLYKGSKEQKVFVAKVDDVYEAIEILEENGHTLAYSPSKSIMGWTLVTNQGVAYHMRWPWKDPSDENCLPQWKHLD
jgi:hypothetical protein